MYRFFAAPLSLYSGKVRGYLRWKNVPFVEEMSSRDIYKTEIIPRVGYAIIPVMAAPDNTTVQDSTDMIDYIEANEDGPKVYPSGPKQKLAALIFELFGDEYLLIAAMHYRWNYNEEFAYAEFGKAVAPEKSGDEQYAIGKAAGSKFRAHLPPLGITDKTHAAIESVYWEFMDGFNTHLETHTHLFGSRPSIGDYGLLGPLYAHNFRDPISGEMMQKRAPNVAAWCLNTHAPQESLSGQFVADDIIADTLLPLLQIFGREHVPILVDTARVFETWVSDNGRDAKIPQKLGQHDYTTRPNDLAPVTESRDVRTYSLWMLGRIFDHLDGLNDEDQLACHALLIDIGAEDLLSVLETPRLKRENFRLALR